MSTRLIVYPYKLGSGSAKALAAELNTKLVKENGRYQFFRNHKIINWGNSRVPNWQTTQSAQATLNKVANVNIASDKIKAFQRLQDQGMAQHLPDWTTSQATAKAWLKTKSPYQNAFHAVVCRTLTHANSGRGIIMAANEEQLVLAPLYTRYKPKTIEFRIHASSDFGIIDMQQKRMRQGAQEEDDYNKYIRSHRHGWVFCRDNLEVPENVKTTSLEALHRLGLNFGAVDIGYHPTYGLSIYEVNTAPGLEGQTLKSYVDMFRKYV